MESKEKIVITGANGLAGSHISEYFSAKGLKPYCMVRDESKADFLKTLDVQIIYGDINKTEELIKCFEGADIIIHTAAKVSDWGKYEDFYKTNVFGTLNVLKAANYCGIKDVIITGSVSCYGEENSYIVKNEEYGYHSHYRYFLDKIFPSGMNFYRDTKAEANIQAIEFAEKNKINLTILEPAWAYGEREFHSGFYEFLNSVKTMPVALGSKKNKFHSIYARELAKIYYLAYKKRLTGINKILAVSPKAEYQYEILDLMCQKAGLKVPVRLPKFLLYPPALLIELVYTLFNIKNPPPISRARVNMFYDNIEYSASKMTELLGYSEDYTFEETRANTINWYKNNNYL